MESDFVRPSRSVAGAVLLPELIPAIRRFVVLSQLDALVVARWVLFTWIFEQWAETNPYLRIISPAPECGKSTLLKVLLRLCRSPWLVARVTAAAFARTIQAERRTLLLDEGDAFLADNEAMRNVLDAASDPDTARTSLCAKSGDDWAPMDLEAYAPIAIASIGTLPNMRTVESRSIMVELERATAEQRKTLLKGRRRELKELLDPIAPKCARFALDNADSLKNARPQLPDELSSREQDKWEPLILIAALCGEEFGKQARQAALDHHAAFEARDASPGETLLAALNDFFEQPVDRLTSFDVCRKLNTSSTSPWREYGGPRRPITEVQVANLLRDFGIRPRTIRLPGGRTAKGYVKSDFEDAWERYLN